MNLYLFKFNTGQFVWIAINWELVMKLGFYFYNECPFCMMVLNTIEELGISGQITMKNIRENPGFRQDLMQLNGRTQVPCLVIDDKPMLESNDIIQFLESNF